MYIYIYAHTNWSNAGHFAIVAFNFTMIAQCQPGLSQLDPQFDRFAGLQSIAVRVANHILWKPDASVDICYFKMQNIGRVWN